MEYGQSAWFAYYGSVTIIVLPSHGTTISGRFCVDSTSGEDAGFLWVQHDALPSQQDKDTLIAASNGAERGLGHQGP